MFASDCDYLRTQLQDPLLDNDSSIKDVITELQAMQEGMGKMFQRMADVSDKVRGAQQAAAELAAAGAKETAKEASAAAATAVKTAAAPGAAAVAPGAPNPDEQMILSRAVARLRAGRSAQGLGAWEVPLAFSRPVHERTSEDAVAAAKACKIARTEKAEQIAEDEQMDADLASS